MDFEQELKRVAEAYRGKGYDVVVRPSSNELPDFAKDFTVEILGRRGTEGVLVAVKKNRDAVTADTNMQRYAEITSSQPGWRFDFAVLEAENPRAREFRGAKEFSGVEITRSLDQAEQLSRTGFDRYAIVAAWAALEAAMRMRLRASGQEAGWGSMPKQMVKELYSAGVMSLDEFRQIELASQLRNQIVHGFSTSPAETETPQGSVVQFLSDIARRMVDESQMVGQPA